MPFEDLTKKYYSIGDVAEILGVRASTLRFWEKKFTIVHPRRSTAGRRYYTPADIEVIGQILYLVKEKGMKLDAAQAALKSNPEGIDTRYRVVSRLRAVRSELAQLLEALNKRR